MVSCSGSRQNRSASASRRRPSSAGSSSGYSSSHIAKGDIGCSPWQPLIEGGPHNSYSEIGGAQLRPALGEAGGNRIVPPSPAHPGAFAHKVSTSDLRLLMEAAEQNAPDPGQRRLTLCPQMRMKGVCRLPSCPYVHEVCRSVKEHSPLWSANAPKNCQTVPCRFLKVLGCCPYADACVYSHAATSASGKYKPPRLGDVSSIAHKKNMDEDGSPSADGAESITSEQEVLNELLGNKPRHFKKARSSGPAGSDNVQGKQTSRQSQRVRSRSPDTSDSD